MNKLDKKLDKLRQKEDSNSDKKIKDAVLLLNAPSQNLEILRHINLDHQIHKNEKVVALHNKLEAFELMYNRKTFTGAQIKQLCNHYDLRCHNASKYKGKVDSELANKLLEFEKETNISLRTRNCWIVSTRESFYEDNDSNQNCVFLYRDGESTENPSLNEVFTVIHSWGENIKESRKYNFLYSFTIFLVLLTLIITLCINSMIATVILTLFSSILILTKCLSETSQDQLWNTFEKN